MTIEVIPTLIGAITASIVWFFVGAAVYMNPVVARIYTRYEDTPSVKDRGDTKTFLINTFLYSILIQCILFAFVYAYIQPVLPDSIALTTLYYGLILAAIKIIPRFFDMWMQSTYPPALLTIEAINGAIGSFVIAFIFAVTI